MKKNKAEDVLLVDVIPIHKKALKYLAEAGFVTLGQCANAGTNKLSLIPWVGEGIVEKINKECVKRGISWTDVEYDIVARRRLKRYLTSTLFITMEEAEVACDILQTPIDPNAKKYNP